jgi:parallel beta-helix repeat protein
VSRVTLYRRSLSNTRTEAVIVRYSYLLSAPGWRMAAFALACVGLAATVGAIGSGEPSDTQRSAAADSVAIAGRGPGSVLSVGDDTKFVSPTGSRDNDGSEMRPWPSVEYALEHIVGGDTLIAEDGIYPAFRVPVRCGGSAEHPTTIRAQHKWAAAVVGSSLHGIEVVQGCSHVILDGFEVSGARYDGVKINGSYCTVRNAWVHNNCQMGISSHGSAHALVGLTLEDNLIEFNGEHIQEHHGIYADGSRLTIRGNLVRHNSAYGIQLYPALDNSIVENNLVYGQANKPGIVIQDPPIGGHNLIRNNTVVDNNGGIALYDASGDTFIDNIITVHGNWPPVFYAMQVPTDTLFDYNLTSPAIPSALPQGSHNMTGDPKFVDPSHGVYYLRTDSPAIGSGLTEQASDRDFWGIKLPMNRRSDLGALRFVPSLSTEATKGRWFMGWSYCFSPTNGKNVPDFWALPDGAS